MTKFRDPEYRRVYESYLKIDFDIAKRLYSNEIGNSWDSAFAHGMKGKLPVYIPKKSFAYVCYLAGVEYVKLNPSVQS